jgi:hypothetical protein
MSGKLARGRRDPRAELRRWAVEQVSANAGLDTLKDVSKICSLADALVSFVTTGDRPIDRSPLGQLH